MSKYTIKEWKAVQAELAAGYTIRETAQRTGADRVAVLRWLHQEKSSEWMWLNMSTTETATAKNRGERNNRKARLTYEDRTYIAVMLSVGQKVTSIA